jgi:glycosidase
MYDCVRDITCGHRRAGDITRQWQATDDIRDHMLYFLENHDEQRIASDFFAGDGFKGIPGLIVSCLLQKNPFMLYAGQEFGERGMEQEGFSGKDGRTTIFDYWSVESIRCGYFDRRKMQKSEKELSALYRKIMKIARREKAVSKGATFDLMYVNQSIADKQYVFLRKAEDELLLVAVNFDGAEANISVAIPRHAFEYMGIPEREVTATDLLTKEQLKTVLIADASVRMTIPAYSGRIYKIKC